MSVIDWNMEARNILKAVRAVGYLEGMSATLWRLAGPEIADEAIVDYDRSVADIAALLAWAARSAWALAVVLTVPVRLACG